MTVDRTFSYSFIGSSGMYANAFVKYNNMCYSEICHRPVPPLPPENGHIDWEWAGLVRHGSVGRTCSVNVDVAVTRSNPLRRINRDMFFWEVKCATLNPKQTMRSNIGIYDGGNDILCSYCADGTISTSFDSSDDVKVSARFTSETNVGVLVDGLIGCVVFFNDRVPVVTLYSPYVRHCKEYQPFVSPLAACNVQILATASFRAVRV